MKNGGIDRTGRDRSYKEKELKRFEYNITIIQQYSIIKEIVRLLNITLEIDLKGFFNELVSIGYITNCCVRNIDFNFVNINDR